MVCRDDSDHFIAPFTATQISSLSRCQFGEPVGGVKIQETGKNFPRYYTLNRLKKDLILDANTRPGKSWYFGGKMR